jgi:hypothetical protein
MKSKRKEEKKKRNPSIKKGGKHSIPLTNVQMWTDRGLGHNVSKLPMGINVAQIYVPFLIMISKKVKVNINVFCL